MLPNRQQVDALAPDEKSVKAATKLARAAKWQGLALDDGAVWGKAEGSSLYDVRIDLGDLVGKCSCPSRKFPCKHVLALLMIAADDPGAFATHQARPAWVGDWIDARKAKEASKEARKEAKANEVVTPETQAKRDDSQAKRAEKRQVEVKSGLDALDLWLRDRVRTGLGELQVGDPIWSQRASALRNAKAARLANRVEALGWIVGGSADWPERLLGAMGRVALLVDAYSRIDTLPEPIQADLRNEIGWNVDKDEVLAKGESIDDRWLVLGQVEEDDERVRSQRSWMYGLSTGRIALLLQFSAGAKAFPERVLVGSAIQAKLAFYPSAWPLRAVVAERADTLDWHGPWPGHPTVDSFFAELGRAAAAIPWIDTMPCALRDVIPVPGDPWWVRDSEGRGVRLAKAQWKLAAVSAGNPVHIYGEWSGDRLDAQVVVAEDRVVTL